MAGGGDTDCGQAQDTFIEFCKNVGIPIKHSKTILPSTRILAHGLEVDSESMVVRLPQDKLIRCREAVELLLSKRSVTLKTIQATHGLLNFACRAIAPGRPFLRRLADAMKGVVRQSHHVKLSVELKRDMQVWLSFLKNFNGTCMFRDADWTQQRVLLFYTDSSGIGFGGFMGKQWYSGVWPESWRELDIQTKEIFPIYIGLALFGSKLKNKKLRIHSDNEAVVKVLNKMSSKSKRLMVFVRLIVYLTLEFNISIRVVHIPGFLNVTADRLSRNMLQMAVRGNPGLDATSLDLPAHLLPENWTL